MLNIIWSLFITISVIFAIITGNIENLNNGMLEGANFAVQLSINLLGTMVMWNGIMQIANETRITDIITKALRPIIAFLFPKVDKRSLLYKEISMNIVANLLGLGNAATPLRNKSNENNATR